MLPAFNQRHTLLSGWHLPDPSAHMHVMKGHALDALAPVPLLIRDSIAVISSIDKHCVYRTPPPLEGTCLCHFRDRSKHCLFLCLTTLRNRPS